ncbi:MAG: hypothetical protein ABJF11_19060 [Reichenbachiella sp.]|uniref:hypothetical protein n=1 Tax=Reichenbachiella sp. TaxID=2184521 RepID=UPI003267C224
MIPKRNMLLALASRKDQLPLWVSLLCCILTFCSVIQACAQLPPRTESQIPIYYQGHLLISAEVSGIQGKFILDTGADNLYLDSVFYTSQTWSFQNVVKALLPGAGTKPKEIDYILDTVLLDFGARSESTSGIPVLDLKSIVGEAADGIIGYGFFKNSILEIQYQDQYMVIHEKLDDMNLTDFEKINVEIINNRIMIPVTIQATSELAVKGLCLLDLGTSRSMILTSSCVENYDLDEKIENKAYYYSSHAGVGGKSSGAVFRAQSMLVGGFQLEGVTIDYSLDSKGALASRDYIGLLGNDILDRFIVLIDYSGKAIYLKAQDNLKDSFIASRTGYSISDKSKSLGFWKVTTLFDDAQAQNAGLSIGDSITHFNGRPVAELSHQDRLQHYKTQESVELTVLQAGKPKVIRIELVQVVD